MATPVLAHPDQWLELSLSRYNRNWRPALPMDELVHNVNLNFKTLSNLAQHNLFCDFALRKIHKLEDTADFALRKDAGHSMKTSIGHQHIRSTLDDFLIPSCGYSVSFKQEFAGNLSKQVLLNTSGCWVKSDVELKAATTLGLDRFDDRWVHISHLSIMINTLIIGIKSNYSWWIYSSDWDRSAPSQNK